MVRESRELFCDSRVHGIFAKTITSKSEKLLSFQIPILTSILVYLFNTNRNNSTLALTAIIALCIVLISLYFSYQTFKKYDIAVTGEFPKNIVTSQFIDKYPSNTTVL